jgi:hypothetical protein
MSPAMRRLRLALLGLLGLLVLSALLRGRRTGPDKPPPVSSARGRLLGEPPPTPSDRLPRLLRGLEEAGAEATPEAARELRALLLADPATFEEGARMLLDPTVHNARRGMLAVVLAALGPAGLAVVLEALRSPQSPALTRTLLLALGIREAEDDRMFEREGQPFAVEAVPGLQVLVYGALEAPAARDAALARLQAEAPELRRAAALVLRDSTTFLEVRRALLEGLRGESDAEAAASLGAWARQAPGGDGERRAVVDALLEVIPTGDEVVRFRLTAPMSALDLEPAEALRLEALATEKEAEVRRFAVDVLGRRASSPASASARLAVERALAADADAEVRESAAHSLGRWRPESRPAAVLQAALHGDPDWEVRAAAAGSLAGIEASRPALEAAAAGDPRLEVRAAARRALGLR